MESSDSGQSYGSRITIFDASKDCQSNPSLSSQNQMDVEVSYCHLSKKQYAEQRRELIHIIENKNANRVRELRIYKKRLSQRRKGISNIDKLHIFVSIYWEEEDLWNEIIKGLNWIQQIRVALYLSATFQQRSSAFRVFTNIMCQNRKNPLFFNSLLYDYLNLTQRILKQMVDISNVKLNKDSLKIFSSLMENNHMTVFILKENILQKLYKKLDFSVKMNKERQYFLRVISGTIRNCLSFAPKLKFNQSQITMIIQFIGSSNKRSECKYVQRISELLIQYLKIEENWDPEVSNFTWNQFIMVLKYKPITMFSFLSRVISKIDLDKKVVCEVIGRMNLVILNQKRLEVDHISKIQVELLSYKQKMTVTTWSKIKATIRNIFNRCLLNKNGKDSCRELYQALILDEIQFKSQINIFQSTEENE